jgi:dihydrofolate synthase/folylpolyglutamate synthase
MALDTYEAALDYLFAATDYEKMQRVRYNADTFSLDRMRHLLAAMGSPERRLRSVHVAGTKGKGSTAAIVHAMALAAGLKAGLYTSPHLVDLRERIRVGRSDIAPEALRQLIAAAQPEVDRMREAADAPTFFEIFTALALRHFADEAVDLAVVEVGLGGRLDATNVLVPDVAVITALSMDHTLQLGDTLEAIAGEKAGIIKPGVPVVSHLQPPEAMAVVERVAREAAAPLFFVGREITYTWEPAEEGGRRGGRLSVRTPRAACEDLFLPLMGEHQAANAAGAIAAAELTGLLGPKLTPDLVRDALAGVVWPGRMEYVAGRPAILLDGAHNRASLERLLEALARHFPATRMVILFAAAADKDIDGMLDALAAGAIPAEIIFTRTATARAADPLDLQTRFRARGREAEAAAPVNIALRLARKLAGEEGLVVACGSLYLVGEVKQM